MVFIKEKSYQPEESRLSFRVRVGEYKKIFFLKKAICKEKLT